MSIPGAGKKEFTIEDLHSFEGKDGRPAFVAYKGRIYDVTNSKLWKEGSYIKNTLQDMTLQMC